MTFFRNLLSAFNLGHASFVGSSALVQLFPLLSAPIIARLYTPAEFGIYAVFFALSAILAGVSALALTNATLLEAEDRDAAHATLLAMAVTLTFCTLLMALILVTPPSAMAAMVGKAVVPYLPWLPLSAVLSGIFTCLYTWAIRTKQFHLLARNSIVLGVATAGLQIGIGLMNPGAIGFILANTSGYALAVMLLVVPFLGDLRRLKPAFSLRSGLAQLNKHRTLPLWTVPANLVNSVCSFLPDLIIGRLFGVAQLGQFSLASRMVNFPLTFIASSAQDIFRQQAAQEFIEHGHCRQAFRRFFLLMGLAAIGLLTPIILLVPDVFPIIFGSQWNQSGVLIQAIGVLLIVRFISSPLSYVWIIRGQYKLNFLWQAGLMSISLTTLLAPPLLKSDISLYQTLWVYSVGVGAWYVLCIFVSRQFAYSEFVHPLRPQILIDRKTVQPAVRRSETVRPAFLQGYGPIMKAAENGTGTERLNLHIFLADILHVNRLFKEAAFTLRGGLFDRVVVVGLWSRGLEQHEVTDYGLEIRRCKVLNRRFADAWPLRFLPLRKLVAALSLMEFAAKAVRQAIRLKPTHVSCHNVVLLPVCWMAARLTGARLVYLPHELETQRAHLRGLAQKTQALIERIFIKAASHVVAVCDPIARWYRQTYGLTNVHVVRNVPERDAVVIKTVPEGDFRQRFAIPASATVFIYQGVFGKARGTDRLLEIFSALSPERAHLVLMGFGDPADHEAIDRHVARHSNIHYQPTVPREWITSHTSGADIGIFIAEAPPLNDRWALPNKFFEFVHSGLPVLVSDNLELLSEIVAEHDIGWSAPYADIPRKIEALIETDVEPYRSRARTYARSAVWDEDALVFETVYGSAGAVGQRTATHADPA